jgi:GT2 family glycosyltransferase
VAVKIVVALHNDTNYNNFLGVTISRLNIPSCIVRDEIGIQESLFQKYNKGIAAFRNSSMNIDDEDVICFMHEDCKVEDPNFIEKLLTVFQMKKDIGLLGVVGSSVLHEHCLWHCNEEKAFEMANNKLCGHLLQVQEGGNETHNVFGNQIGFYDNLCVVDGFFLAIRGKLLNDGMIFDDKTFCGYDFYDLDICLEVLKRGYKVGIADILLKHKSGGESINKPTWQVSKFVFIEKWKKEGKTFPITIDQFKMEDHYTLPKINSEITLIEI